MTAATMKQDLLECNNRVRNAGTPRTLMVWISQLVPSLLLVNTVVFSVEGWSTCMLMHSQCGGLRFATTSGASKVESARCCLMDTQCQKITRKTCNAHKAETLMAMLHLLTAERYPFACLELSRYEVVSASRFPGSADGERILMAQVLDNQRHPIKGSMSSNRLRRGRTGYTLSGDICDYQLSFFLTKLPERNPETG